jgi:hypothetical protein
MTAPLNEAHPDFKLTYELALIEHLGLNLYSEVHAAISELIANAYDAEANAVEVRLPLGTPLGLESQRILIKDDGHGMSYEECRDKYLRIGRNRRRTSRKSKNRTRTVIGKKGIGKLAGFGIANEVTISTVSDGRHTEFRLRFDELEKAPLAALASVGSARAAAAGVGDSESDAVREYKPDLLRVDEPTTEPDGTTVTLRRLRPLDPIDLDTFVFQMARKFAIFGNDFAVTLFRGEAMDGRVLAKFDVPCQFRFPDSGWAEENLAAPRSGSQIVRYWIGFQESTIKDASVRGISVMGNGKSVQEAFDFKVTGGTTGQFGLQYMTGEVQADWLDDQTVDVVASDRASIRWSDPDANALLTWGRQKVRELLERWVELRAEETKKRLKRAAPELFDEIEKYQGEAKKELEKLVDRVTSVMSPLGEDRTRTVISSVVAGFSHTHIREVLKHVAESADGLDLFVRALDEWELVDAVLTFQELSVKLQAIQTLAILVKAGATEVKSKSGHMSLSEHLARYPWLIDPMFKEMQHEVSVDNFIEARSGKLPKKDRKRVDFIVLYDSTRLRLVELKSAKDPVDSRGLNNLIDYHGRLKVSEAKRDQERSVRSLLIYNGDAAADAGGLLSMIRAMRDEYEVLTWKELLDRNTMIYKEQLKRVKEKNPTDPRVVPLWELIRKGQGAAIESGRRRLSRTDDRTTDARGVGSSARKPKGRKSVL